MWQRRQKAQRGDMSHSFSITELLPFTLCEQEYGSGKVWKAGDKLCSMWHNSSQETANPRAHKELYLTPLSEGAAATLDSASLVGKAGAGPQCYLCTAVGPGTRATCASCTHKAGARGLLDIPAAPLTKRRHRNCVEAKLVSNSSLDRRLKGLTLNCYMLLEKTTK